MAVAQPEYGPGSYCSEFAYFCIDVPEEETPDYLSTILVDYTCASYVTFPGWTQLTEEHRFDVDSMEFVVYMADLVKGKINYEIKPMFERVMLESEEILKNPTLFAALRAVLGPNEGGFFWPSNPRIKIEISKEKIEEVCRLLVTYEIEGTMYGTDRERPVDAYDFYYYMGQFVY